MEDDSGVRSDEAPLTMSGGTDRLARLGWSPFFADAFAKAGEPDLEPARVGIEHNHLFRVYTATGELLARAAGKLKHAADKPSALPAVGDWVGIRTGQEGEAQIRMLLPRRTCFSRKAAGETTTQQVVAANVDTVFLVSGLDDDFNPRRLERYVVATSQSGASAVIVLNKADLCPDVARAVDRIKGIAGPIPIHLTNCHDHTGIDELAGYLTDGRTVALLGSSGVGKSTIINCLLGHERQRTRTVRQRDSRGRHTTVHRELLVHPDGGLIIDTPGMRELRLWDTDEGLESAFEDIEALAAACRFRDCEHRTEPGCAVARAVTEGRLSATRVAHFHKLQDERAHLDKRRDELAQLADKQRVKRVHRAYRRVLKR